MVPCSAAAVGDAVLSVTAAIVPTATAVQLLDLHGNQRLVDMGFSDQRENLLVLAKYGNDVNQTLNELMRLKYFRDQQQQRAAEVAPNIHSTTNSAPHIRFHNTSKAIGNTTATSSVAASAKVSSAKKTTLVIKKVPTDKENIIADALR